MAQLTETEINEKIEAIDSQLDELVSSGIVGVSSGGSGGLTIRGEAITSLIALREHYVKMRDKLVSGDIVTLDYDIDEFGEDQSEYMDG
mgnify:CR=1 FL=1